MILQYLGVNRSQTLEHRTKQLNTYVLNLKVTKEELYIFPVKRWIFWMKVKVSVWIKLGSI